MRRITIIAICFAILIGIPSNAFAASLQLNLTVWSDSAQLFIDEDEIIPSNKEIQTTLLQNCKTELEYRVGTKVRAINQAQATVGIGKLASVKIGKVHKAYAPTYGVDGRKVYPVFFAPCIFTGTISNLRSANFYTFEIGGGVTGEYDNSELKKKKWKLNLVIEDIQCFNLQVSATSEEDDYLELPEGCEN